MSVNDEGELGKTKQKKYRESRIVPFPGNQTSQARATATGLLIHGFNALAPAKSRPRVKLESSGGVVVRVEE